MEKPTSVLDRYPEYRMDIGIEVHVQLNTKSKIFCSCSNAQTQVPNLNICPICAGYPGVLPVLNKQVVEFAVMAGLGTNCEISEVSEFDRKHYFYPDLPKNYQITQNDFPICRNGYVMIRLEDGSTKKIRINRIHIEEDAGKNTHSDYTGESFVDLNRTGTPLIEIVTETDIDNAEQARAYLKALRTIMQYLGVSTCNMEEGSFRADTNLSVRKKDSAELGTRCELKNINSFKFIGDAIEYEAERQILAVMNGEKIVQETRLWDSKNRVSVSMRKKEGMADYRFFTDPDLALVKVTPELLAHVQANFPEMPFPKFDRYKQQFNLSDYEAEIITSDLALTQYFDALMACHESKSATNWLLRDVLGALKEQKVTIEEFKVTPDKLAMLIKFVEDGVINNKVAKEVFDLIAKEGGNPAEIIESKGLKQIGSADELEAIVKEVFAQNPHLVEEYKAGKQNLFGFFVGACMKATHGNGDPKLLQALVKKYLS
ncbi:Asp-tRNA(Asn)/Glu-tRNA(Gln) amidotransferase subunit GatB [Candidatus Chromulinivorax destructor]|nr:Asp-tRNA(Asn)/Glu-tRNA(Gln) amidotransferase subunit GatB [Candidatus Chromulinivorax destructor]